MNRNIQRGFARRNNNNNYQNNRSNNNNNQSANRFQRRTNFEEGNHFSNHSTNHSGGANNWRTRDNRVLKRRVISGRNWSNRNYTNDHNQNDRNQNDSRNNTEKWFRITVPNSSRLEPFFVVNAIKQLSDFEFTPFNYSVRGSAIQFYVQGDDLHSSIKSLSKRIASPDGTKLFIRTERANLPVIDCTPEFVEKLKIIMSRRYDLTSKFLNLSQLSTDEDFLNMRLYVSLQRINVCEEVVKIIIENIPDLVSLNLSNNKIQMLEPFKPIVTICKSLKELNLSYNNINNIDNLNNLKGLEIETLNIDFNPFKNGIRDKSQENYARLIRQRFPKVVNLDGVSIPPPISFDVEEPTTLPETKESCIPNHLRDFVTDFVKNYFTYFDSDDRQSLLNLYYEQANFSFTIGKFDRRNKQQKIESNLLMDSRNLLRINDNQSNKLLRQGKANVVSTLSNLPKTEHILPSFKIDVPVFYNNFIVININGLYKSKRPYALKAFSRNFLIVSHNNSFAIVNDLLSIATPTVENINYIKNLYKNDPNQDIHFMESMDEMADSVVQMNSIIHEDSLNSMGTNQMNTALNTHNSINFTDSIVNQTGLNQEQNALNNNQINLLNNNNNINLTMNPSPNVMISSANQISQLTNSPNSELIKQFANVTGMNLQYSKQCLEENNYDAKEALRIFKSLKDTNMIPEDCFR